MKYLTLDSTDPCYNMAFESWCLKNLPGAEAYFYLWRNSPSVIIGENQNAYNEVNLEFLSQSGVKLARRTTGGGAVYHDLNNVNYSFIGEDVSAELMAEALRTLGVPAELTGRNDIFVEGKKVSGYARRLEGGRALVHGTLLYDVDLTVLQKALDTPVSKMTRKGVKSVKSAVANLKDYLPQCPDVLSFKDAVLGCFDVEPYALSEEQLAGIQALCDGQFATHEWIYGRSPESSFANRAAFACGTVEADFVVDKGVLRSVRFTGDFLGWKSAGELAEKIEGLPYKREIILDALKKEHIEDYFDNLTAEELARLLFEGDFL